MCVEGGGGRTNAQGQTLTWLNRNITSVKFETPTPHFDCQGKRGGRGGDQQR